MPYKLDENLCKLSEEGSDIELARKEWVLWERKVTNNPTINCLCGHTLKMNTKQPNVNIFINIKNRRFVGIGNGCVKKFGLNKKKTKYVQYIDDIKHLCGGEYIEIEDCFKYSDKIIEWLIKDYMNSEDIVVIIEIVSNYTGSTVIIEGLLTHIKTSWSINEIKKFINLLEGQLSATKFKKEIIDIIKKLKEMEIAHTIKAKETKRKADELKKENLRKVHELKKEADERRAEEERQAVIARQMLAHVKNPCKCEYSKTYYRHHPNGINLCITCKKVINPNNKPLIREEVKKCENKQQTLHNFFRID